MYLLSKPDNMEQRSLRFMSVRGYYDVPNKSKERRKGNLLKMKMVKNPINQRSCSHNWIYFTSDEDICTICNQTRSGTSFVENASGDSISKRESKMTLDEQYQHIATLHIERLRVAAQVVIYDYDYDHGDKILMELQNAAAKFLMKELKIEEK